MLVSLIYAYRGDKEATFRLLEKALDEDDDELIEIRMNPYYDKFHEDPRWDALLNEIGIADDHARDAGF